MIITSVIGINYNAIFLSNKKLTAAKVETYAGCKVRITSVFVRSSTLKDGYYFLPDGRIVKDYPKGYCACISYTDVQGWKCVNQNCHIYGLECGIDKDGDEFYSGRTPHEKELI